MRRITTKEITPELSLLSRRPYAMKYSRFRIALLTFTLGMASVSFFDSLDGKWNASYVELPQVKSDSPIVIKVCPKFKPLTAVKGGGSGGFDDAMCDSIPVALLERHE